MQIDGDNQFGLVSLTQKLTELLNQSFEKLQSTVPAEDQPGKSVTESKSKKPVPKQITMKEKPVPLDSISNKDSQEGMQSDAYVPTNLEFDPVEEMKMKEYDWAQLAEEPMLFNDQSMCSEFMEDKLKKELKACENNIRLFKKKAKGNLLLILNIADC